MNSAAYFEMIEISPETLFGIEHFLLRQFNFSFSTSLLRILKITNRC